MPTPSMGPKLRLWIRNHRHQVDVLEHLSVGRDYFTNANHDYLEYEPEKVRITYLSTKKAEEVALAGEDPWTSKKRQFMKPSRMLKAIVSPYYAWQYNDYYTWEKIANIVAAEALTQEAIITLVTGGEEIAKWYDGANYARMGTGTLDNSCMRSRTYTADITRFYGQPNVSLAIMQSPADKTTIVGRALVWTAMDGKRYMDRCFASDGGRITLREWAWKNGILTRHCDTKNTEVHQWHSSAADWQHESPIIHMPDCDKGSVWLDTFRFALQDAQMLSVVAHGPAWVQIQRYAY